MALGVCMKPMSVRDDIIPIGEFKTHASRVIRQLRDTGRPIVITQNGRPAGVLVSAAEFDRLTERDRFVEAVREGLADSEAGRLVSDAELTAEFNARHRQKA